MAGGLETRNQLEIVRWYREKFGLGETAVNAYVYEAAKGTSVLTRGLTYLRKVRESFRCKMRLGISHSKCSVTPSDIQSPSILILLLLEMMRISVEIGVTSRFQACLWASFGV